MVGRWALVRSADNVVDNVIEYDGVAPYTPPAGTFLVDGTTKDVGPGYLYDPATGDFTDPDEPAP